MLPGSEAGHYDITSEPYFSETNFPAGVSFTVKAIPEEGYLLDSIVVSGGLTGEYTGTNEVVLTMPEADVNIVLYFTLGDPHNITVTSVPVGVGDPVVSHETAMPGVTVTVTWGDTGEEYRFDGVTVSGEHSELSVDESSRKATFKMGNQDVTVTVKFTHLYFVSYDPEASATVTWSPMKDSYEAGETINISVTAGDDYALDSVSLNGAGYECGGVTSYAVEYTFGSEDLWIQVTSRRIIFHVSYTGDETPTSSVESGHEGDTITFTLPTPIDAYYIVTATTTSGEAVTVTGGGDLSYSFILPASDVTVYIQRIE